MKRTFSSWRRSLSVAAFSVAEKTPDMARFDATQAIELTSLEAIRNMSPALLRPLEVECQIGDLATRVCPVLCADQSVVFLAVSGYVGSDQTDELVRRVQTMGYQLAQPQRYVVSATVLMSIVRGQALNHSRPEAHLDPARRTTALASAFQDIVEWGVNSQASDVHFNIFQDAPESEVRFTIAGRYVLPERFQGISTHNLLEMLAVAWMDIRAGNGAVFDPLSEQQGAMTRKVSGRAILLRWASVSAERGPSVCLRLLPRDQVVQSYSLQDLGYLPSQVEKISQSMRSEGGAILFAGTVGAGKSTTLATLMAGIPAYRKIMTLEDPVEYLIPGAVQNTIAREPGTASSGSFDSKLMALKRSAMTDVLLGEIRDRETGKAFMDLAGSGVSIYSTTHASSALLAAERLVSGSVGVPRDFLATPGVLKMVVYQALLPCLCMKCALSEQEERLRLKEHLPHAEQDFLLLLNQMDRLYVGDFSRLRFRNPEGCLACCEKNISALNGYAGRTVVAESLEPVLVDGYLEALRRADYSALVSNSDGNANRDCAMKVAVQKAFDGRIDPRDIETRFHAFATEIRLRERGARVKAALLKGRA